MSHCQNCGNHVSERFKRVFGIEDGRVYACPDCSPNAGIEAVSRNRSEAE